MQLRTIITEKSDEEQEKILKEVEAYLKRKYPERKRGNQEIKYEYNRNGNLEIWAKDTSSGKDDFDARTIMLGPGKGYHQSTKDLINEIENYILKKYPQFRDPYFRPKFIKGWAKLEVFKRHA
jgi:hypothetical protein